MITYFSKIPIRFEIFANISNIFEIFGYIFYK